MVVIFQMGLIEADKQQIVEISWLGLKLGDDGDSQLSFSGKLVA